MLKRRRRHQAVLAVVIILTCLTWAAGYVYEAASDPFGGDETALFIRPIFYLLVAAGVWASIEAIVDRRDDARPAAVGGSADEDDAYGATGLADHRRLILIASFPLMLVVIGLLGFVISAALYVVVMAHGLGERRYVVLGMLALLAVTVVWLFFKTLLGVPLALWPPALG
jgi:hypothetical protein